MIRFEMQDGTPMCVAEVNGRYGIYLDNWAIVDLAKGPTGRRQRFLDALRQRGTLLFSMTNAAEVGGPQGLSSDKVMTFFTEVGHYWVPVEMSPWTVAEREQAGNAHAPVAADFVTAFGTERWNDLQKSSTVVDLTADTFFNLAAVVEWTRDGRDDLVTDMSEMDRTLKAAIAKADDIEDGPDWLDRVMPPMVYSERFRMTYVLNHLTRTLIRERKSHTLKRNDATDFCHAAMAAAYGSLAALDYGWKRRVETIPNPNGNKVARVYYAPELDALVARLEGLPDLTARVGA